MEFKMHPFNKLKDYFCVDIMALYKGKWIFCKHKDRDIWENPGGHIDEGETPLEAAKRELYEETGAINFDIEAKHHWKLPKGNYMKKREQLISILNLFVIIMLTGK